MTRSLEKSNEHYQRAQKRLPLGVSSNYRAWGPERTIYIERAKGPRIWDLDDNEYIDYRLGYGPAILGHCDDRVDAAAREGMKHSGTTALSTVREAVVAERIKKMVPAADLVRFANSGTEAVMAALRLARAFTGKDGQIMVEGGFHGLFDSVLWEIKPVEDPNSGLQPAGAGVPEVLRDLVNIVPLNDANCLEDVLKRRGDSIGAFLIEPILGNAGSITAGEQYMKDARELCDRFDVVMLIDEVKTGFRVARGGVQELMNVRADLCTFAKALGNGYPISALAGREDIMRKIGPNGVAQGGTYAAHPVPLAAAEKTLEILDETDTLERIADYGRRLQEGISGILSTRGIAHVFTGHPSMAGLFFTESVPHNYREWAATDYELYNSLALELNELGILCEPDSREPWFVSAAHDDACLAETLEKFEIALSTVLGRKGLATANV
ncbi:MAG: aminotransferase class III-fold pyridoxal phosphate-dependent enzyme [Myxococcales bacterium]|nr:aminotransferase class III-fold pyridoxal phosphate-dependent enzyme [Myxococcales bacterium]